MASSRILVIGATGGVGGAVLRQLQTVPHLPPIRVSTRDPTKASLPSSVDVVQGDLRDPTSYSRLFHGIDRVFLYARADAPLDELCAVAKAEGVQQLVLLSSFTVIEFPDIEIGRYHKQVEDAILRSGLAYTFIRAGSFTSNIRWEWLPMMAQTGKVIVAFPSARSAPVTDDDMAAVAVTALTTDRLRNRATLLTGPDSLTPSDRIMAINRLREREGRKPVEMVTLAPEEWKAVAIDKMNLSPQMANQFLRVWQARDEKPEAICSSNQFSDRPSQSFEEWLELGKSEFLSF
jgi:uncharacterized protein YbjT (DUF2867 family)